MPNHLAHETSPYLLQHKDNPVDWYPWGEEAFTRARTEDKPIFLSIGYSACHWCHVMAHESFEDGETARLLNDSFVSIKVDREERPDVDSIYMSAVQAITGSGGWPLTVFLLPDGRPFFGGTYFPQTARHGMPSFSQILRRVAQTYADNRAGLATDADNLTNVLRRTISLSDGISGLPGDEAFEAAFQAIAGRFDIHHGGFGSQPKFPPSMTLELLLRIYKRLGSEHALEMTARTLDGMAHGGIYDLVGGGFHRYSTDNQWLVPHFEKMLYDNALLTRIYLLGYLVTGNARYRSVAEQTIAYVGREMTDPEGGFYSSQDADAGGHEGEFYVWSASEITQALSTLPHADAVLDYWGIAAGPNFEGNNVLWIPQDAETVARHYGLESGTLTLAVAEAGQILFRLRQERTRPQTDTKILAAWNGLMIQSLALAGQVLNQPAYLAMATRAADFIWTHMRLDGRLHRSYKDGQARHEGCLEDYAFLAEGLIELYQRTFDSRWFTAARDLCDQIVTLFWDDDTGFYDTAYDHEELIARPQELMDNVIPSGTSSAVAALLRMAILADRSDWRMKAEKVVARLASAFQRYPDAFAYLGCQFDFLRSRPLEIALVGNPESEDMQALLRVLSSQYLPYVVTALTVGNGEAANLIPFLKNRGMIDGKATAYVCRNSACRLPATTPESLLEEINAMLIA